MPGRAALSRLCSHGAQNRKQQGLRQMAATFCSKQYTHREVLLLKNICNLLNYTLLAQSKKPNSLVSI